MIPLIDFREVSARNPEAMKHLRRAGEEWGIFYLEGTGIPSALPEQVTEVSEQFFSLPIETKKRLTLNDREDFRGYVALGEELTNGKPDLKESYEFARSEDRPGDAPPRAFDPLYGAGPWPEPSSSPRFRPVIEDYMGRVEHLAGEMMQIFIDSLDVDPDHRDPQWNEPLHYRTRLIHYQRLDGLKEGALRVDEHTDLALFNLLRINAPGLEAKNADGDWFSVGPRPGSFVVILGELCRWWTAGEYRAGVHRVRQAAVNGVRTSMPFFFYPNLQTDLRTVHGALAPEVGEKLCGDILYERLVGVHPEDS